MSINNLNDNEALEKMAEMVNNIKFAMFLSALDEVPISAVPMTTKKVDEKGDIWFISSEKSEHNTNIHADSKVQLLYSDPSDMEFISIYGKAEITKDREVLEELYEKIDDNWFQGINDPNLSAIKVSPKEAYYWDRKENKYISLFKMGVAAATGEKADIGEKGKLNL